jgi:ketosteroid isomerase-like protein
MWNSYNLDLVDELFLADSGVTYLSTEREGTIKGIQAVREHHASLGFVTGGGPQETTMWVENLQVSAPARVAIVTGTWHFRRGPDATGELQRGPMTLVYVPTDDGYRIAHAHFADY